MSSARSNQAVATSEPNLDAGRGCRGPNPRRTAGPAAARPTVPTAVPPYRPRNSRLVRLAWPDLPVPCPNILLLGSRGQLSTRQDYAGRIRRSKQGDQADGSTYVTWGLPQRLRLVYAWHRA